MKPTCYSKFLLPYFKLFLIVLHAWTEKVIFIDITLTNSKFIKQGLFCGEILCILFVFSLVGVLIFLFYRSVIMRALLCGFFIITRTLRIISFLYILPCWLLLNQYTMNQVSLILIKLVFVVSDS